MYLGLWVTAPTVGQHNFTREIEFYQHLYTQQLTDDASLHLQNLLNTSTLLPSQRDSVYFYLGYLYYEQQNIGRALHYFNNVQSKNHPFYSQTQFTKSFLYSYDGNFSAADSTLQNLQTNQALHTDLQYFQRAVNALLARKYAAFDSLSENLSGKFYVFTKPLENLQLARTDLANFRRKSTAVAGTLSAIVPGSGKIYAGKLGEGIASLLQCTFLGLQSLEAWNRKPTLRNNPRFWVYGGLFSAFYIGNIWGTVLSVHIRRKEFYDTIDRSIHVDMHIPLRTIFR